MRFTVPQIEVSMTDKNKMHEITTTTKKPSGISSRTALATTVTIATLSTVKFV